MCEFVASVDKITSFHTQAEVVRILADFVPPQLKLVLYVRAGEETEKLKNITGEFKVKITHGAPPTMVITNNDWIGIFDDFQMLTTDPSNETL